MPKDAKTDEVEDLKKQLATITQQLGDPNYLKALALKAGILKPEEKKKRERPSAVEVELPEGVDEEATKLAQVILDAVNKTLVSNLSYIEEFVTEKLGEVEGKTIGEIKRRDEQAEARHVNKYLEEHPEIQEDPKLLAKVKEFYNEGKPVERAHDLAVKDLGLSKSKTSSTNEEEEEEGETQKPRQTRRSVRTSDTDVEEEESEGDLKIKDKPITIKDAAKESVNELMKTHGEAMKDILA